MTTLTGLLPEDIDAVISLPVRVGVWMSHIDDEPGAIDDRRERLALEAALKHVSKDRSRAEFVREIAEECTLHRNRWDSWAGQSLVNMPDVESALKIAHRHAAPDEAEDYARMLYEMAEAVACAHGEFGTSPEDYTGGLFGHLMDRIRARRQDRNALNISPAEQEGLERLRDAVKL